MRLGFEAQALIGLRLFRMVTGGVSAVAEAGRMLPGKAAALAEAQRIMALSVVTRQPHTAPAKVVPLSRGRVEANKKRLTKTRSETR